MRRQRNPELLPLPQSGCSPHLGPCVQGEVSPLGSGGQRVEKTYRETGRESRDPPAPAQVAMMGRSQHVGPAFGLGEHV